MAKFKIDAEIWIEGPYVVDTYDARCVVQQMLEDFADNNTDGPNITVNIRCVTPQTKN